MTDLTKYWIHMISGQGPNECDLAVYHLSGRITKEAKHFHLKAELTEAIPGNRVETYASALISINGEKSKDFISSWKGIVQWICSSPFRPYHRRKNWFVDIDILSSPYLEQTIINNQDVVFKTMRASGPGRQHVNTTDSAVRATHIPTGTVAVAREERSQHMNKKLALARLVLQLERKNQATIALNKQDTWSRHQKLERGNPSRIFMGSEFKEKKFK